VYIIDNTINLRDQVRKGQTTPLQFAYEPADCRIYFTPKTIANYTALWQYAADAVWNNPALCVEGSTGVRPVDFPESSSPSTFDLANYLPIDPSLIPLEDLDDLADGLVSDLTDGTGRAALQFPSCNVLGKTCPHSKLYCANIQRFKNDKTLTPTCVPTCRGAGTPCSGGTCRITSPNTSPPTDKPNPPAGYCELVPLDNKFAGANRTITLLS
jgi:hypothetical protein